MAAGTFDNTATVTAPAGITDPNPANNSATDTDTLTRPIDLSITKDDGVTAVSPGDVVTYAIVISNPSPWPAAATVTDLVPASLTNVTWTAIETGGCPCFPASGTGSINASGEIANDGTLTITLTGTVAADATGSLTNTATVQGDATDPNPANNSATDTDTVYPPPSLVFDSGLLSGDWGISVIGHGLKPGATLYACENGVGCHAAPSDVPDANGDLTLPGPLFACGISSNYFPIYYKTLTAAGVDIDSNQVTTPPC
jgi:uncharacterized repeat protein (TIGR01451 family)